jgi:hypothetical protein
MDKLIHRPRRDHESTLKANNLESESTCSKYKNRYYVNKKKKQTELLMGVGLKKVAKGSGEPSTGGKSQLISSTLGRNEILENLERGQTPREKEILKLCYKYNVHPSK